jgi:Protein of unknown function (DUF998)
MNLHISGLRDPRHTGEPSSGEAKSASHKGLRLGAFLPAHPFRSLHPSPSLSDTFIIDAPAVTVAVADGAIVDTVPLAAPSQATERPLVSPPATRAATRQIIGEILGVAGLVAYNWWALVPLRPGLMKSPDELFSDLEVSGQPFASAMQHADFVSGLLVLAAFLVIGGRTVPGARREWIAMGVFGLAGAIGGIFSEACPDGISATCRHLEWTLALPLHHYLHIVSGIVEFGAITVALFWAYRRTSGDQTHRARVYRFLWKAIVVAYPFLALAYLTNRLGSIIEAVFFVIFSSIVVTQLLERSTALHSADLSRQELGTPAETSSSVN